MSLMSVAPGPLLETPRLILRPTAMADFGRWCELMADPEASRFIGGVQEPSQVWRAMMSVAGAWTLSGIGFFSVIEKATGRWIGRIGPWQPADWPGTEVGWSLHPDATGQGYALEAAVRTIDYAFDTLDWAEVIHCIDPDNTPSARLAEKLGSTNRGPGRMPVPFQDHPVDVWGQTREQWATNRLRLLP